MDGQPTPFATRAVRATKDSSSLRVTIPQVIAATLGIRPGDDVVWIVDPDDGRVRVIASHRPPPAGKADEGRPETT
jgi:bifunctional DNA-binding transcriptional regulator/antitoxin component of YhaV-PrlF toxin-antitoxin module